MKLNNKGDTLIEVLISLALIGVVLGSSFGLASRSYRIGQRTQERLEALKLVESQIEKSKLIFASSTTLFVGTTLANRGVFCVSPNATSYTESDLIVSTDAGCKQGTNNRYSLTIDAVGTNNDLVYKATWERYGGGTEQLSIPYKYYK